MTRKTSLALIELVGCLFVLAVIAAAPDAPRPEPVQTVEMR